MTRYAAFLRGVNVNGITIKSADLAALFTELGFTGVKTVLASGNVLFETDAPGTTKDRKPTAAAPADKPATVKRTIEKGLRDRFGYDAWIVLVDHTDLAAIVDGYPFDEVDDLQPYVVFASEPAVVTEVAEFASALDQAADGERARAGSGVVYWEVPKGHSVDTALAKYLAKPKFKATTTTRNLRTLRKLL
jgi:uncharacterized protein (DUF1697 family)